LVVLPIIGIGRLLHWYWAIVVYTVDTYKFLFFIGRLLGADYRLTDNRPVPYWCISGCIDGSGQFCTMFIFPHSYL